MDAIANEIPQYEKLISFIILTTLYAMAHWNVAMFKTKVSKYKMRGELAIPTPPENYCKKGLCPPDVKHIACDNPFWGPECKKPREGVNMEILQTTLVDLHNNLRNRLTLNSTLPNLPRAKQMPKVRWDFELSMLAMRVTNFCNDEGISQCVNVPRFLNVAKSTYSVKRNNIADVEDFLTNEVIIGTWFNHSQNVGKLFAVRFPENATKKDHELGNLINRRVICFGCGMLIQKGNMTHFTCLYNVQMKPGMAAYYLKPDNLDKL